MVTLFWTLFVLGRITNAIEAQLEHCKSYDYIVVGAGSTGGTLAARLSEIQDWNVLLLEAGSEGNLYTKVPYFTVLLQRTNMDWQYKTETQGTSCQAMIDEKCLWPRGKVLGGTSSINNMVYTRGDRRDYDDWAALGNEGWSYKDVLPYFKKAEGNTISYLSNSPYHGTEGPLTVSDLTWRTPLGMSFVKAGFDSGYKNSDPNGEVMEGFSLIQFTIRNGERWSTERAYIDPARKRNNFNVISGALVTKVIIDHKTKHAKGVEYIKAGETFTVKVNKEVIICAGAINSPQLLMLSGIGPKEHLQHVEVEMIKDLPGVGQNLHDHVASGGLLFVLDKPVSIVSSRINTLDDAVIKEYAENRTGPYVMPAGHEAVGFVYTKYADKTRDAPDIEFLLHATSPPSEGSSGVTSPNFGFKPSFYDAYFRPIIDHDAFIIEPYLLQPKSRGDIKLRSKNPLDYPIITSNYLTHPNDSAVILEGIRIGLTLGEHWAFKMFGARLHKIPIPGCEHHTFSSDAYWLCAMRHYTWPGHHQGGTCKMGPSSDPNAVVDSQLRVYGIKGLRVADASITPQMISGHTNSAAIMIGEKLADLIKIAEGYNYVQT